MPKVFFLNRQRSILEILKTGFSFVTDNAKIFYSSIGIFVLPLILISTFLAIELTDNFHPFEEIMYFKEKLDKKYFLYFSILIFLYVLGVAAYTQIINKIIVLKGCGENENIPFQTISENFQKQIIKNSGNFIIFFLISYISKILFDQFFGFLNYYQSSYNTSSDDVVYYYIESIVKYIPIIVCVPLFSYFMFATIYVSYRDKTDSSGAFKKVVAVTKPRLKKAWLTSSIIIIISLVIYSGFTQAFSLLGFFISNLSLDAALQVYKIILLIKISFTVIVIAYANTSSIILFGSLEDEKENKSLLNKIHEIL